MKSLLKKALCATLLTVAAVGSIESNPISTIGNIVSFGYSIGKLGLQTGLALTLWQNATPAFIKEPINKSVKDGYESITQECNGILPTIPHIKTALADSFGTVKKTITTIKDYRKNVMYTAGAAATLYFLSFLP